MITNSERTDERFAMTTTDESCVYEHRKLMEGDSLGNICSVLFKGRQGSNETPRFLAFEL